MMEVLALVVLSGEGHGECELKTISGGKVSGISGLIYADEGGII